MPRGAAAASAVLALEALPATWLGVWLAALGTDWRRVGASIGSRDWTLEHTVYTLRPPAPTGSRRLAVMVVGQVQRFYLERTLRHVVAPAVREGYDVDYYAMLSLANSPSVGYNPFNSYWFRPAPNPATTNLTTDALRERVVRHARHHGVSRALLFLFREDVPVDELPRAAGWRRRWLGSSSPEATMFMRDRHRLKQIELLWNWTAAPSGGREYHHVLLIRDDAYWVDDVHMSDFPDPQAIYSRQFGSLCVRSPASGPADQVLVVGGQVAGRFLTLYSEYYHNPSPELDMHDSFEHFILLVARVKGIRWEMVPKPRLPYFTALHMRQPQWDEPLLCLRGITRAQLEHPTDECIHPARISLPFCSDFPLL